MKEKFYSNGSNKLLRTGLAVALVAGMTVPADVYVSAGEGAVNQVADAIKDATKEVKDTEAEVKDTEEVEKDTEAKDTEEVKKDEEVAKTETTEKVEKTEKSDTTSNDVLGATATALLSGVEEQVTTLQANDAYLTDKVQFGTTYVSIKGTTEDPYFYAEPVSGTSSTLTVGFENWETYKASNYYTSVIAPYADKITRIEIADGANIKLEGNCCCLFSGLPALTDISDLAKVDTSGVTQMAEMFSHDSMLNDLSPIANWDVSNVKMMYMMFAECPMLTSTSALSGWTTSSLTDISAMFYDDQSLIDISALGSWDLSKLTEIYNIFSGCKFLTDISVLSEIDVSNVDNFTGVFGGCSSLSNFAPVSEWNTEKGTAFSSTFAGCAMTDTNDLAGWKTGNSLQFAGTFTGCPNLKDLSGLSKWETSNGLTFQAMFAACPSIETLDGLEKWDVSAGLYLDAMFMYCTGLKDASAIGSWTPGNATQMTAFMDADTELTTLDLSPLANNALQTNSFTDISTSKIRHFKVTEDKADTEAIMAENNICNLEMMEGTGLYYQLRDTDKTYNSWTELMNDFSTISGQWVDVIVPHDVKFYTDTDTSKDPITTIKGIEDEAIGEFSVAEPAKKGYNFKGWYYVKDGAETDFNKDTVITEDTNVFAKWEVIEYTITYTNTKDVTNPNVTKYTVEDNVKLSDLSKTGYEFQGWTKAAVTNEPSLMAHIDGAITEIPTGSTGNITLVANWKAIPYTITYAGCEDATNDNPTTYTIEDKITLNTPTKAGYTFNGWTDSKGATTTEIPTGSTGNITVTANWLKNDTKTYQIKQSVTGGTISGLTEVEEGKNCVVTYAGIDSNYKLKSVTVDGVAIEDLTNYQTSYTFENVTNNHEISVVFEQDAITKGTTDENGKVTLTDPTTGQNIVVTVTYEDDFDESTPPVPLKDVVVTIDENGKIHVAASEGSDNGISDVLSIATLIVNVSTEDGVGIANKEVTATVGYFDVTGTTGEDGNVTWTSININVETQNIDIKVTNGQLETTGFLFNSSFTKDDYEGYSGISLTGNPVKKGETASVTYKPNDGYKLKSVTIDGVDKTSENADSVTFEDVQADHTVEVVYEKSDTSTVDTNSGTTDSKPSASSDLPSTGDATIWSALVASLAGAFGGGLALSRKQQNAKLSNRKH